MKPGGTQGVDTIWVLTQPAPAEVRIWGLSPTERLCRGLRSIGLAPEQIDVGPVSEIRQQKGSVLVFRADYVFDERLVRGLAATPTANNALLISSTDPQQVVAAHVQDERRDDVCRLLSGEALLETLSSQDCFHPMTPTELVPAYHPQLRKSEPPFLLAAQPERTAEIEARIFNASYKGITDLVTKWVWPRPAQVVTRVLAQAGVRPNVVTSVSWVLVVLTTWLFSSGQFGLGLFTAWLMTFLDTVDGKLARVTLTSSRIGNVLDHGLDLIHPPFWYLAWALGVSVEAVWLGPAIMIILIGYILGRLIEGVFQLAFKMEIHSWRPIDSFFRTITARRNPNLILLTLGVLMGRPDWGLVLVAGWTFVSLAFHLVRLAQACVQQWRGLPLQQWQESEAVA